MENPYGVPADLPLYVVALTATTLQLSTYAGGPPLALSPATMLALNFVIYTPATQASYEDSRIVLTTPLLFLTLRCKEYPDLRNIRCLFGDHADSTHLLFRGGVTQGLDGAPAFIEWYAKAEQTQRWNLRDVIVIGFETRNGTPLTVFSETSQSQLLDMDPQRQLVMSFLVTPFVRDATYSNHFLEPEEGKIPQVRSLSEKNLLTGSHRKSTTIAHNNPNRSIHMREDSSPPPAE